MFCVAPTAEAGSVTWEFTFSSAEFSFDFGTVSTDEVGQFTYEDTLQPVFNGEGFPVTDFQLGGLHLDSARDIFWVPDPLFDNTTIEESDADLNDRWELFDGSGVLRFQLIANPDGLGGFAGIMRENLTGAPPATVTYTQLIPEPSMALLLASGLAALAVTVRRRAS